MRLLFRVLIVNMKTHSNTRISNKTTIAEPSERRFCKAKTIARKLDICTRTLFRWANAGLVTRHKINARCVLFDEAEIVAFIQSARIETPRALPSKEQPTYSQLTLFR